MRRETTTECAGAKRDEHLDAVKGFAILVVMVGHCIGRNHMNDPYINDAIMSVQMPLFMMASGYAGGMTKRELSEIGDVWSVQKRRAVSYLLPFFSWVFVVSLLRPFDRIQNPFAECYKVLFHIDSGLWFLVTLFLIQLMVMLDELAAGRAAAHFHRQRRGVCHTCFFAAGAALLYLLCILWGRSGSTFLGPSFLVQYLPFYLAGYLASHYLMYRIRGEGAEMPDVRKKWMRTLIGWLRVHGNRMIWCLWGTALIAFLACVICFDLQSNETVFRLLIRMCASFLGSFVCFWGIYHLPVKQRYGLSFLGRYTLEIYALHFRFVDMLGFRDMGLSLYSLKGLGAVIVTFLVMSILSGWIIYAVKKIPVLDLLLFGRRRNPD